MSDKNQVRDVSLTVLGFVIFLLLFVWSVSTANSLAW